MEHLPGLGESLEGGNISSSEGPRILVENISSDERIPGSGAGNIASGTLFQKPIEISMINH
jgi:hypothetical protein